MSQAKVDKYKAEKKNRAKTIKKVKIKKILTVFVCAALVGVMIGFPLGKHLYNVNYDKRMANATITSGLYGYWFNDHWEKNYSNLFTDASEIIDTSTLTDEEMAKLQEAISAAGATNTDSNSSTVDESE